MIGKSWRQEQKGTTEDEMVGWHHRLEGHEFEQALGVGDEQGTLVCCSAWGWKELDSTERLSWTDEIGIGVRADSRSLSSRVKSLQWEDQASHQSCFTGWVGQTSHSKAPTSHLLTGPTFLSNRSFLIFIFISLEFSLQMCVVLHLWEWMVYMHVVTLKYLTSWNVPSLWLCWTNVLCIKLYCHLGSFVHSLFIHNLLTFNTGESNIFVLGIQRGIRNRAWGDWHLMDKRVHRWLMQ